MIKFRSMKSAVDNNGYMLPDSQRLTPFGEHLRSTSLDELPQFINVLKGDMSIVGPRPERPVFVEKFKNEIPYYMQKHLVKAGITGWAQINGWRGDTSLEKRIEYDIFYIENWSLWFDLKIIFMTIFKGHLLDKMNLNSGGIEMKRILILLFLLLHSILMSDAWINRFLTVGDIITSDWSRIIAIDVDSGFFYYIHFVGCYAPFGIVGRHYSINLRKCAKRTVTVVQFATIEDNLQQY